MLTLNAATAADVMTAGPYSLDAATSPETAAAFLTHRGFGAAVVIDEAGHPIGVVTKTDLLIHGSETSGSSQRATTTVRDLMTPAVFSVRQDTPIRSVVEQFLTLNVHHLFVSDNSGVVIGIISPFDLLRKLG